MLTPTVHYSTISNWERGRRIPGPAQLAQLADTLKWGTNEARALAAERHLTMGGAGQSSARLEALLRGLREAYYEAFEDGQVAAYSEAQKQLQLLRKQLASERGQVARQRDQLLQLQRSAEIRRLAEHDRQTS
jgi:transcriptional regulator with XRE-family HTH domain